MKLNPPSSEKDANSKNGQLYNSVLNAFMTESNGGIMPRSVTFQNAKWIRVMDNEVVSFVSDGSVSGFDTHYSKVSSTKKSSNPVKITPKSIVPPLPMDSNE